MNILIPGFRRLGCTLSPGRSVDNVPDALGTLVLDPASLLPLLLMLAPELNRDTGFIIGLMAAFHMSVLRLAIASSAPFDDATAEAAFCAGSTPRW